jgi:hypothetical protein
MTNKPKECRHEWAMRFDDHLNPIGKYCENCDLPQKPTPPEPKEWEERLKLMKTLGVDEWIKQGRSEEQIYGVKNFLTGLGGARILKLLTTEREAGRREMRKELALRGFLNTADEILFGETIQPKATKQPPKQ